MTLIVDRSADHDRTGEDGPNAAETPERKRIDVTDLHAAGVEEFVRSSVDTDAVSLENRGARTYLVLDER
ncbi:hypothetical protein [Natrarchaeobius oligotrophus]|uniref:Uncharacterized protein n=1 Tax=Natrarchaeobius chitinivorans TaxID=1679083 RepID=A0A3N6PQ98_NATCH|nr:hypothetical protein [Natrarchaeobius chitinivorans]RQH01436.1 hypothetical protein EA472_08330 [Natrarchaeobius chitinivorans]